ncbi:hypothetical protein CTAYLR_008285 [Chrysophaeum taylorii]|uniref:RXYLT1 C-terminal domain-containing protein n=1 Tax=Chrysophaeum taylorii TaxID=2483200 RepID=A0AAD7U6F2_9STRA|nr:hypothetical protein CTAYLR_008285 [Chrysophaeum taylorii]
MGGEIDVTRFPRQKAPMMVSSSPYRTFSSPQQQDKTKTKTKTKTGWRVGAAAVGGFALWSVAIAGGLKPRTVPSVDEPGDAIATRLAAHSMNASAVVVSEWSAGDLEPAVRVDEHFVHAPCFGEQTYAYWRYALNGPKATTGRRRVLATSHFYGSREKLIWALETRRIKPRSLVFVDVRYTGLDYEWDYEALSSDLGLDSASLVDVGHRRRQPGLDEEVLDPTCVYDYTPDLVLRSRLLRRVLSYPEPLVVVVSGDVACRLALPQTHHRILVSDDAGGAQCEKIGALWWPQGLEGLVDYAMGNESEADALAVANARWLPPDRRPFLFNDAFSVNVRKPSRLSLVTYVHQGGGAGDIKALAAEARRGARFEATVDPQAAPFGTVAVDVPPPFPPPDPEDYAGSAWRANVAGSMFAICAAGDVYSTGRVVAAMALGAVPVIDATYNTDAGASAKGCEDPARFWRDGTADFPHKAPFVFVDKWDDLPVELEKAGAVDLSRFRRRLEAMADYRTRLEAYLRDLAILPWTKPNTTCVETPFSSDDRRSVLESVARYYEPRGPNPTAWFDDHRDSPRTPGATCSSGISTEMTDVDIGALCFDPACAPPLVKSFECH